MERVRLLALLPALVALAIQFVMGQSPLESSQPLITEVKVQADQPWTPTGVQVGVGDEITVSATGVIQTNLKGASAKPAGVPPDCRNIEVEVPFIAPQLPCWSLLGRIGTTGNIFEVGADKHFKATSTGELYLGVNDNFFGDNSGNWHATVVGGRPFILTESEVGSVVSGCEGRPKSQHMNLAVSRLDLRSGLVDLNGFDDRKPGIIPCTWIWGDGNVTQGWFPQSHKFVNSERDYILQVRSHEADGSTDCAQILIPFRTVRGYGSSTSGATTGAKAPDGVVNKDAAFSAKMSAGSCTRFWVRPHTMQDLNYDLKWNGVAVQVNMRYVVFECGRTSYMAVQNSLIDWRSGDDSPKLERITFYKNWRDEKLNLSIHQDNDWKTLSRSDKLQLSIGALDEREKSKLLNDNPGLQETIFNELSRFIPPPVTPIRR
jgi:hypothetical protein